MINGNIFFVDFIKLAQWIVPVDLRKSKTIAFVTALVQGVVETYSRFMAYRTNTAYWLSITSQVCRMEKALNDRWDIALRRIEIVDGIERNAVPFFLRAENKPVRIFKEDELTQLVLWTKAETLMFTSDFIVKVPSDVVFDLAEMTALVNKIKMLSKTFIIVIV